MIVQIVNRLKIGVQENLEIKAVLISCLGKFGFEIVSYDKEIKESRNTLKDSV